MATYINDRMLQMQKKYMVARTECSICNNVVVPYDEICSQVSRTESSKFKYYGHRYQGQNVPYAIMWLQVSRTECSI